MPAQKLAYPRPVPEGSHPHRDSMMRGQMVELSLSGEAAHEDVLFVGAKPLWF